MKRFAIFIFLVLGLAFGLNAYSVSPNISVEGKDYSYVWFKFGSLLAIGGVFSANFKKFLKGSTLFKKSEEEYSEDNAPIQKGEGVDNLDEKLNELKSAIDDGSVTMDEESIRGWCSTNGVSDEDCDYIVSTLLDTGDEMAKSDSPAVPDEPEMDHDEPDGDEFEKSFLKYLNKLENKIVSHDKQLSEFKKSELKTLDSLKAKDKEISFLKSELAKYANSPVNPKTPAKEGSQTNLSMARPEIIGKIKKGMTVGLCSLDDLMAFESKGKLPENFSLIKD